MTTNTHILNIDSHYPFRGLGGSLGVCVIFAVAFVGAALWRWWCVPYGDDYIYSHMFETDGLTRQSNNWLGHPITTLGDAWTSTCRHYLTAPGRLANSLSFFMALLPHWFLVVIGALSVAAQPLLAALVAGGRRVLRRPTALAALYILMWLLLPWFDHMQSVVFLTNYVFSACAILTAMLIYRNAAPTDREESRPRAVQQPIVTKLLVNCLIALVAGWMHEGFSVALIAWMIGVLVFSVNFREFTGISHAFRYIWYKRRPQLWMLLCALLGFVLSLSPGTLGRIGESTRPGMHVPVQDMVLMVPVGVLAVVTVWLGYRAIRMSRARTPLPPSQRLRALGPYWLGIAANLGVVVVSHASGRALWPAILLSLMAMWHMVYKSGPLRWRWLWMPLTAVYALMIYALVSAQIRVSEVHNRVHALLGSSNIVFCDSISTSAPWYTFGVPLTDKYTDWLNLHFENQAAQGSGMPVILPTVCRGLAWQQWPEVPGDNPYRGSLSHMVTADSVGVAQLRLHMGEPLPSMTPLKRLITSVYGKVSTDAQLVVAPTFDRIGVVDGDTLYRVSLPPMPYLWSDRAVIAVDLIK